MIKENLSAAGGQGRKDATAYFHYYPSSGDPRLFVMADHETPSPEEKFFEEYRAFKAIDGVGPRPLDPRYLPKVITLEAKRKIPPIFCTVGWVVLDSTVRSAMEALEPDRHQFIPVKMVHRNGEEEPREFFMLNVHYVVEAMAVEEMGAEHLISLDGRPFLELPMAAMRKIKLRRSAIDWSAHLFCDPQCANPGGITIISKEMISAIKSAKGRLFELTPCEVVD